MSGRPGAVAERHDFYLTEYDRFVRERGAAAPAWLRDLRGRALTSFAEAGFPTTRHEDWRFTNIAPIADTPFRLAGGPAPAGDGLVQSISFERAAARLVVVNGRFVAELSHVSAGSGIHASGLSAALASDTPDADRQFAKVSYDDRPFVALNTAFLEDGVTVTVAPKALVSDPIHVVIATTPGAVPVVTHPRVVIVVGESARATIVESYVGRAGSTHLTNGVTEIVVGDNAVVEHYKDQREPLTAYHVTTTQARLGRSSTFASQSFSFGGRIVRNDIFAELRGEGGECTLNGLYFSDGQRLVDNHTTIDHATPHCASHELYKGILAGRARAVFNGKIIVRPDAQKTNAKQTNRALLLSDDAQINTKPQLEIFADDVKCTHGAAIGQLDDEAVFYLRSRGLNAIEARDLLIHAFAGEILNRVKVDPVRTQMEDALFAQLARDLEGRV